VKLPPGEIIAIVMDSHEGGALLLKEGMFAVLAFSSAIRTLTSYKTSVSIEGDTLA
jgi:hypothetical protein